MESGCISQRGVGSAHAAAHRCRRRPERSVSRVQRDAWPSRRAGGGDAKSNRRPPDSRLLARNGRSTGILPGRRSRPSIITFCGRRRCSRSGRCCNIAPASRLSRAILRVRPIFRSADRVRGSAWVFLSRSVPPGELDEFIVCRAAENNRIAFPKLLDEAREHSDLRRAREGNVLRLEEAHPPLPGKARFVDCLKGRLTFFLDLIEH